MNEISVIVPSYNSALTIGQTLDGILSQKGDRLAEAIVVDSSDDGKTPAVLEKYADRVRVIRLDKKTMPAIGRNIGAAQSKGQILAFIDSDAFPAPDWLENIGRVFEEGSRVGGGAIFVPEFQKNNDLAQAQYFLQFNEFTGGAPKKAVNFVPSCNLFCEKRLFDSVGGFPRIRAAEDVLFGEAARKESPVMFHPEIRVFHIFRNEKEAYYKNQILLGKYVLIYRRSRNPMRFQAWSVIPLLPLYFLFKMTRIEFRVLRGDKKNILPFLKAYPLFFLGALYWTLGFLLASLEKDPA